MMLDKNFLLKAELKLLYFVLILIILIVVDFGCSGSGCSGCNFRTNFKDDENKNNDHGLGRFNENGSPPLCEKNGTAWPSFTFQVKIDGEWKDVVTNSGVALENNGHSSWIGGNCFTQDQLKKISGFQIKNSANLSFLVKGHGNVCPHSCIVYAINFLKSFRYTIDKGHCGVNPDIPTYALKDPQTHSCLCKNCNCNH
jgi:hypothetical protein